MYCPPHFAEDDPAALRALRDDPAWRERMAAAGHTRYLAGNSIAAVGRQMKEALLMLVEDF